MLDGTMAQEAAAPEQRQFPVVKDAKAHLERLTQQSIYLRFNGKSKATEYLAKQPRGHLFTTCVKRGRNGSFYFKNLFSRQSTGVLDAPICVQAAWLCRGVKGLECNWAVRAASLSRREWLGYGGLYLVKGLNPCKLATTAGRKRSIRVSQGWISGEVKLKSPTDCQPAMAQELSKIVA